MKLVFSLILQFGAALILNTKGADRIMTEPKSSGIFPSWERAIKQSDGNELLMLERIDSTTSKSAARGFDRLLDEIWEEGGEIEGRDVADGNEVTLMISPSVKINSSDQLCSAAVRIHHLRVEGESILTSSLTITVNRRFKDWQKQNEMSESNFFRKCSVLAFREASRDGFTVLKDIVITFEKTGGFHTNFEGFIFRIQFTSIDVRTLPVRELKQAYYSFTGLRDVVLADGTVLPSSGRLLRTVSVAGTDPCARLEDGTAIWKE